MSSRKREKQEKKGFSSNLQMKEYRCKQCSKKLDPKGTVVINGDTKNIFCDTKKSPLEPGSCSRKYLEENLDSLDLGHGGGWHWIRLSDYEEYLKDGDYKIIAK